MKKNKIKWEIKILFFMINLFSLYQINSINAVQKRIEQFLGNINPNHTVDLKLHEVKCVFLFSIPLQI